MLAEDARAVLGPYAPFDLLFADGGWRDPDGLASLVELVRVGERLVMDDVTPGSSVRPDVKGGLFFGDPGCSWSRSSCPICAIRCCLAPSWLPKEG